VLGKAGKAIARANTWAAQLEAENKRLQYQLTQVKSTQSRKRVRIDQNERFSNVEAIKAAIEQATAKAAENASKSPTKEAAVAVTAATATALQSMCTQWQI
jgi:hypothetical protein